MKRVIQRIAALYGDDMKFEKRAMDMIIQDLEHYLFSVCVNANICAKSSKRVTLYARDMRMQHYIHTHRP